MHLELELARFRADLSEVVREIASLKKLLGARWVRPMADEQRRLARLKQSATELCILRAHSRGRSQLRSEQAAEQQRLVVERLAPVYSSSPWKESA